jgi:hypothetical protein
MAPLKTARSCLYKYTAGKPYRKLGWIVSYFRSFLSVIFSASHGVCIIARIAFPPGRIVNIAAMFTNGLGYNTRLSSNGLA